MVKKILPESERDQRTFDLLEYQFYKYVDSDIYDLLAGLIWNLNKERQGDLEFSPIETITEELFRLKDGTCVRFEYSLKIIPPMTPQQIQGVRNDYGA